MSPNTTFRMLAFPYVGTVHLFRVLKEEAVGSEASIGYIGRPVPKQ